MSWKIVLETETVHYTIGDESFTTSDIQLVKSELHNEPGGYKEPEDTVVEETYSADSEHGTFTWKVRARRSGFETYAAIEDIFEISIPSSEIEADTPSFDVENED
jgi:hypothetical protein